MSRQGIGQIPLANGTRQSVRIWSRHSVCRDTSGSTWMFLLMRAARRGPAGLRNPSAHPAQGSGTRAFSHSSPVRSCYQGHLPLSGCYPMFPPVGAVLRCHLSHHPADRGKERASCAPVGACRGGGEESSSSNAARAGSAWSRLNPPLLSANDGTGAVGGEPPRYSPRADCRTCCAR